MSHTVPTNERTVDAVIVALVLLGVVLATIRGARLVDYSRLDLVVPIVLPALIATVVYLRFVPEVRALVPVGLFAWGCLAGALAMFVGFFAVVDNPTAAPGGVTTTYLVVDALGRFLASALGLSVVYAAAGYTGRVVPVAVAPVVQFLVLVPLAFVLR